MVSKDVDYNNFIWSRFYPRNIFDYDYQYEIIKEDMEFLSDVLGDNEDRIIFAESAIHYYSKKISCLSWSVNAKEMRKNLIKVRKNLDEISKIFINDVMAPDHYHSSFNEMMRDRMFALQNPMNYAGPMHNLLDIYIHKMLSFPKEKWANDELYALCLDQVSKNKENYLKSFLITLESVITTCDEILNDMNKKTGASSDQFLTLLVGDISDMFFMGDNNRKYSRSDFVWKFLLLTKRHLERIGLIEYSKLHGMTENTVARCMKLAVHRQGQSIDEKLAHLNPVKAILLQRNESGWSPT